MSLKIRTFQETPNPNALKCVLDRRIADKPRSYFRAEEASGDSLGSRLFSIPGIVNVLIHSDWITVGKRPEAEWKYIKSAVERVLSEASV